MLNHCVIATYIIVKVPFSKTFPDCFETPWVLYLSYSLGALNDIMKVAKTTLHCRMTWIYYIDGHNSGN